MRKITEYFLFFFKVYAAILLMELIFRGFTLGFTGEGNEYLLLNLLTIFAFSLVFSGLITMITYSLPAKWGKLFFSVILAALSVMYCAQIVYYDIFETFYTTYSMMNGSQVTEFQEIIWSTIFRQLIPLVLEFSVAGLLIWYVWKREESLSEGKKREKKILWICGILSLLIGAGGAGSGVFFCSLGDEEDLNAPAQYLYQFNEIKGSARSFGLLSASCIDTWRLVFGFEPALEEENILPAASAFSAEEYNVVETLDFSALAAQEEEEVLRKMDEYFGSREPSEKNEKTGIFAGKNLVFITAESFSDFAVSREYTPTLYKLQQEGFHFRNFYNPIWGVSTLDGEYVNCLGMIPKTGVWSMKEAGQNSLPFALGNQFRKLGYVTKAYHDHSIYYYDRNLSHPNLGYDFDGQDGSFHFQDTWPESDLEMMEKTVPDLLDAVEQAGEDTPFHVYYLTVSGHMDYTFQSHDIARKNEALVEDLPLSEACKVYMAANIELDRAMESLLDQLEKAGELEDTVIVLAGDHYPYGLTKEEISEFRGHEVDTTYELYESGLILWTPGMKAEEVDKVCSNLDILPTISNLFGLEYDSRLLMGKDIFSEQEGLVVFEDKNWITEKGTRKDLLKLAEHDESLEDYIAQTDEKVADMFTYSALVLDEDYYRKIFATGS